MHEHHIAEWRAIIDNISPENEDEDEIFAALTNAESATFIIDFDIVNELYHTVHSKTISE